MYRDDFGNTYSESDITTFYKLTSEWSDKLAAQEYRLVTLIELPNGERRITTTSVGDAEWAKRIAEHYNIEETK